MPALPAPVIVARKVIEAARKWLQSRAKLRQVMARGVQTKAAQRVIEKARKVHIEDADKLEAAVLAFEKLLATNVPAKRKKTSKPIPWKQVLDVATVGLGALNKVVNAQPAPEYVKATVIDEDGRPV